MPKEPRSTVAVTPNDATPAPQPAASTATELALSVVHDGADDAYDVRPSVVKSRLVAVSVDGSTKSTTTVKAPDEATPMPPCVARSPSGASCDGPPTMRTPVGSGSCRKSDAAPLANTAPPHALGCHAAATMCSPQSRTASVVTATRHGASSAYAHAALSPAAPVYTSPATP